MQLDVVIVEVRKLLFAVKFVSLFVFFESCFYRAHRSERALQNKLLRAFYGQLPLNFVCISFLVIVI